MRLPFIYWIFIVEIDCNELKIEIENKEIAFTVVQKSAAKEEEGYVGVVF